MFVSFRQREVGRRIQRFYLRRTENLEEKLMKAEKKTDRYKKRLQRMRDLRESPRFKVDQMIRRASPRSIRRTLLFHTAIAEEMRTKYAHSKKESHRQLTAGVITSKILKKYKLQKLAQETLGFSRRRWKTHGNENVCSYKRKKHNGIGSKLRENVVSFIERDDVSRTTTGKKETVTKGGNKKQKRLLLDSIKNLHLKFLAEETNLHLSYSLFCTLRPFWVVQPTLADRDTCLCKQHENLSFIAKRLHHIQVIDTFNLESLAEAITCDTTNKQCMYGECEQCKDNTYALTSHYNPTERVSYIQWSTEDKKHKDSESTSKVTLKKECKLTQEDLVETFNTLLQKFRRHLFNIRQQYAFSRALKQNLPPT